VTIYASPKRLIEVDLPIKRVSEHARREKSIRHGHISTLHVWWARRPLAACRTVICAALWPDPADEHCPASFVETARSEMTAWARDHASLASPESFKRFVAIQKNPHRLSDPNELRVALLDFIADFANWDNSNVREYLETSRALTQAAHEALGGTPGTRPLVVDPFAGGGAIPLEALRVGADAFASDLNPVAVLLNKVVLEYIPKYGQRLADEVRKWGDWIKKEAEKELDPLYPKDCDGAVPIAYLWARLIRCEGPACGAEVPLMRSLWLAKKGEESVALQIVRDHQRKRVDFKILRGAKPGDVGDGTMRKAAPTCPLCGYTTPNESIRKQMVEQHGGSSSARLVAVVTTRLGGGGRTYRLPVPQDAEAIREASARYAGLLASQRDGLSAIPNEAIPHERVWKNNPIRVHLYGMARWGDLFAPRQAVVLECLTRLVCNLRADSDVSAAVRTCLALAVSRQADYGSALCSWHVGGEKMRNTFGRQALPMVWDFAEVNPLSGMTGGFSGAMEWVADVCERGTELVGSGHATLSDAADHPLPTDCASAFITDPPYYDAVPYAKLSNFFYAWLRRMLGHTQPELFTETLLDGERECVVDEARGQDKSYFERKMVAALNEGRRVLDLKGIGMIVFAHKSTAGWEAQLSAMLEAGWTITASWPIDTEMGSRLRAVGSAALASSIHLVCRSRESLQDSSGPSVGDWRDILSELPRRIHDWIPRLAHEGIVGADAIFACLGPALEIFSRFARVEKASGEQVSLREYLEHVWAAIAREALATIFAGADATGFEEDARLTAMWLWTLRTADANGAEGERAAEEADDEDTASKKASGGGFVLEYDAARKIAQGLGAHLEDLATLVEVAGQSARLLPVAERARALFGKDEGRVVASRKKREPQMDLFKVLQDAEDSQASFGDAKVKSVRNTVLDRVHQSMILFAAGRGEALTRFLVEDGAGRDERFWQLAQALSALYPSISDEKRWVDGVMARKKALAL